MKKWEYLSNGELKGRIGVVALETIGEITASATDADVIPLIDGVRIAVEAILRHIEEDGQDDKSGED